MSSESERGSVAPQPLGPCPVPTPETIGRDQRVLVATIAVAISTRIGRWTAVDENSCEVR